MAQKTFCYINQISRSCREIYAHFYVKWPIKRKTNTHASLLSQKYCQKMTLKLYSLSRSSGKKISPWSLSILLQLKSHNPLEQFLKGSSFR